MKCPMCGFAESSVINSRPAEGGSEIRRRRVCLNDQCKARFTTFERVDMEPLTVIKRSGTRERYDREKLVSGLRRATEKRPIGESPEAIRNLAIAIEREAFDGGDREVRTEKLGVLVLKHLKDADKVAYLRFASVYKQFQDLLDFNAEIEDLRK